MGKLRKVGAEFAQVSWEVARDPLLTPSLESLGAHTLIQATPDDFEISVEWLAGQKSNGYRAAKKAVNELIAAGLYHRVRVLEGSLWRTYVICPATPLGWDEAIAAAGIEGTVSRVPDQTGRTNLQVVTGSPVVGTPSVGTPATGTPRVGYPDDGDPVHAESYRESDQRESLKESAPPPPAEGGPDEDQDPLLDAARRLLSSLTSPWLLGPLDVIQLAPSVVPHLRAGWTPAALVDYLTRNPGGVRDPARVLGTRRLPNVPPPPGRRAAGRPTVCAEHHLDEPCRSCAADRRVAGGR